MTEFLNKQMQSSIQQLTDNGDSSTGEVKSLAETTLALIVELVKSPR